MVAVLLCAVDPPGSRLALVRKYGPSSYQGAGEIRCSTGPVSVVAGSNGQVFVTSSVSDSVGVIDLTRHRTLNGIKVGWAPSSLALVPESEYLLVCNAGADSVSVVDIRGAVEAGRVAVGREPREVVMASGSQAAYVCEQGAGSVCALDLTSLRPGRPDAVSVAWRTSLGPHAQPRALLPTSSGPALVLCRTTDRLPVIDLASGHVMAEVALPGPGGASGAVELEGGFALVTLERLGAIAVVDLMEWSVTRLIPVGPRPRGIVVDPDDRTVYCPLPLTGGLAVIHLDGVDLSNEDGVPQFESVRVGSAPRSLTVVRCTDSDSGAWPAPACLPPR
ncbi:YncE family protein [Streptomyces sp. gb1(2016)]|uniref:YncE family protein n=1 Tax=Streptomyces sp. gb1(2016) TaxID=1828321 RepID=A0A652LEM9_9ACTN|nr:YncE family protein [Streptomyces sp. gb1(2016)]